MKDLIHPNNIQRIRNVDRSWNDRSERIIHCVFSMLCDFVETEHGGVQRFRDKIEKNWSYARNNHLVLTRDDPGLLRSLENQYKTCTLICDLYDWYNSIDWKNCDEYSDFPQGFLDQKLKDAIDTRGYWWT